VDNLVIIDTPDAVLVANKDKVQEVKQIVEQLKKEQRSEAVLHREAYRPWGKYDSVDSGERFQVKRLPSNLALNCRCKCIIIERNTGS